MDAAAEDILRRTEYIAEAAGPAAAERSADALLRWLERIAESGAQVGTEWPEDARLRTFGYRRQGTVLAEFDADTMVVVRIYFAGQDWTR